jgi:adenosylmethionine-8-amino-7-oxononanoate aminotransferase
MDATCIDSPRRQHTLVHLQVRTLIANGNYRKGAALLGFSDLKRLKNERPLVFDRGKVDDSGKDYIKADPCFYCAAFGFSDEQLIKAAIRQLKSLPPCPSAIDRTVPAVMELTERLATIALVKKPRIYFATTGSEANNYLIKFMWYGNGFAGEPQRRKMISRRASYHGSTIATAPVGAMIAKPVSVSSGMFSPPASYFTRISSVCHKYGVQLFVDEVVTEYTTRDQASR